MEATTWHAGSVEPPNTASPRHRAARRVDGVEAENLIRAPPTTARVSQNKNCPAPGCRPTLRFCISTGRSSRPHTRSSARDCIFHQYIQSRSRSSAAVMPRAPAAGHAVGQYNSTVDGLGVRRSRGGAAASALVLVHGHRACGAISLEPHHSACCSSRNSRGRTSTSRPSPRAGRSRHNYRRTSSRSSSPRWRRTCKSAPASPTRIAAVLVVTRQVAMHQKLVVVVAVAVADPGLGAAVSSLTVLDITRFAVQVRRRRRRAAPRRGPVRHRILVQARRHAVPGAWTVSSTHATSLESLR